MGSSQVKSSGAVMSSLPVGPLMHMPAGEIIGKWELLHPSAMCGLEVRILHFLWPRVSSYLFGPGFSYMILCIHMLLQPQFLPIS